MLCPVCEYKEIILKKIGKSILLITWIDLVFIAIPSVASLLLFSASVATSAIFAVLPVGIICILAQLIWSLFQSEYKINLISTILLALVALSWAAVATTLFLGIVTLPLTLSLASTIGFGILLALACIHTLVKEHQEEDFNKILTVTPVVDKLDQIYSEREFGNYRWLHGKVQVYMCDRLVATSVVFTGYNPIDDTHSHIIHSYEKSAAENKELLSLVVDKKIGHTCRGVFEKGYKLFTSILVEIFFEGNDDLQIPEDTIEKIFSFFLELKPMRLGNGSWEVIEPTPHTLLDSSRVAFRRIKCDTINSILSDAKDLHSKRESLHS